MPNPNGSAPGQWLDTIFDGYRKLIMLIPGPPGECKPLFDAECLPRLREIASAALHRQAHAEGGDDSRVAGRQAAGAHLHHYTDVETTILAHAGDIQLT